MSMMGSFTISHRWTVTNCASNTHQPCSISATMRGIGLGKSHNALRFSIRAFASRKSMKKQKRDRKLDSVEESNVVDKSSTGGDSEKDDKSVDNLTSQILTNVPSRSSVLQACAVTCSLIAALGLIIRQVSHIASVEGLLVLDCSTEVSFGFEIWHLELITGLVILISSCRYLLLKTWPDFAESNEAANRQVLTSLEPLDYLFVAFLPGITEELLFRGALQPLLGNDWKSILAVASLFGVLHLGGGRKYSFAVWATFVGLVYGYATILTSSIIVPMASHGLNNLIGGVLWHYNTSKSLK